MPISQGRGAPTAWASAELPDMLIATRLMPARLIIVFIAANSRRYRNIGRSIPLRSPIQTRLGPALTSIRLPDRVREIKVPDSVMVGIAAVALTSNDADGEQPHG